MGPWPTYLPANAGDDPRLYQGTGYGPSLLILADQETARQLIRCRFYSLPRLRQRSFRFYYYFTVSSSDESFDLPSDY